MIPINELRIGNWVIDTFPNGKINYVQVHSIYDETGILGDTINDSSPNSFKPIPLTPELLEALGITLAGNGFEHRWTTTGRLDILINYSYITTVDYLHEYQNLFFALMGAELTLPESLHP